MLSALHTNDSKHVYIHFHLSVMIHMNKKNVKFCLKLVSGDKNYLSLWFSDVLQDKYFP